MNKIDSKKLCYINNDCAYFTSFPISDVYGDDWNDSPYELNAGPPYEEFDITKVYFETNAYQAPINNYTCSVDLINSKKIPWLIPISGKKDMLPIFAGTTLIDFKKMIKDAGGKIYLEEVNS